MNLDLYPQTEISDAIDLTEVQVLELNDGSLDGMLFGFEFEPADKPEP